MSNHFPCCRPFSTWYGHEMLTSILEAFHGPKLRTMYLWKTRLPISSSYFCRWNRIHKRFLEHLHSSMTELLSANKRTVFQVNVRECPSLSQTEKFSSVRDQTVKHRFDYRLTIAASPLISPPYLTCWSSEFPDNSSSAFRITSAVSVTESSLSIFSELVLKEKQEYEPWWPVVTKSDIRGRVNLNLKTSFWIWKTHWIESELEFDESFVKRIS